MKRKLRKFVISSHPVDGFVAINGEHSIRKRIVYVWCAFGKLKESRKRKKENMELIWLRLFVFLVSVSAYSVYCVSAHEVSSLGMWNLWSCGTFFVLFSLQAITEEQMRSSGQMVRNVCQPKFKVPDGKVNVRPECVAQCSFISWFNSDRCCWGDPGP